MPSVAAPAVEAATRRSARSILCVAGLAAVLAVSGLGVETLPFAYADDAWEVADQPAAGPAFSSFDAYTRMLNGTAQPGSTVVLADQSGQVVSQTSARDDGMFSLELPAGVYALDGYRVSSFDENWSQIGEPLYGEQVAGSVADALEARAEEELAQIRTAIAARPSLGVAAADDRAGQGAPAASEEGLPVLPYALGAASAVLSIGVVAGAGAVALGMRRRRAEQMEDVTALDAGMLEAPLGDSAAEAVARHEEPAVSMREDVAEAPVDSSDRIRHEVEPAAVVDSPADCLDELERIALSFVDEATVEDGDPDAAWVDGDYEQVDDDPTAALEAPLSPQGTAEFERMAKILASGAGKVHRVSAPAAPVQQDASATDELPHDWYDIALRELAADGTAASKIQATADFEALTTGNMSIPDRAVATGYVAPVVGPRSLSDDALERHMNYVDASATPRAAALRERDDLFRLSRAPQVEPDASAQDASSTTMWLRAAKRGLTSRMQAVRDDAGVPVIARGNRGRISIPDIESADYVPVSTPSPYGVAAAQAAVRYGMPDLAPKFGSDYAAQIASNVYSEANVTGSMNLYSSQPKVVTQIEKSVAAAYASAVYSAVAPIATPARGHEAAQPVSETSNGKTEAMRSLDDSGVIEHSFTPSSLTPDYIDYMVQDEFEHRHDTTSQRNAALGVMRVVNGSAASPVPLDAGLEHLRHRA